MVMSFSSIQCLDTQRSEIQLNDLEQIRSSQRQRGLFAQWILEEGKLLCRWFPVQF
jgi:hypothetical protein